MKPPAYTLGVWLRIGLKVLVLFVIFNWLFGVFHVANEIEKISIYGTLAPYRTRLIDQAEAGNEFAPLPILLRSHEISRPKAPNEFRIVTLGNSGILGAGNSNDSTIASLMTASGQSIDGKQIRAYNLAHPEGSVTRDLLIGTASLDYQPDLIVWFVSMGDLRSDNLNPLIEVNSPLMTSLTERFGFTHLAAQTYGHVADTWWENSFLAQRSNLYLWLKFQTYLAIHRFDFKEVRTGIIQNSSIPDTPLQAPNDPVYFPMPTPTWDTLTVLKQVATVPILFVNQPMYADTQHPINYNVEFSRTAYDSFRQSFAVFCQDHQLWCLDIWDVVPNDLYTDSDFHRNREGNAIVAERVTSEIEQKLGH
jgi:hypothetical protein